MPGPPPKHPSERRRRNRDGLGSGLVQLPAEGRSGDSPSWPLSAPTKREAETWRRVWATPQAVAWERLGWTDVVARYCRQLTLAEKRGASAAALGEVRQLEDRLGLTPLALLRLRWEISADELAEVRVSQNRERMRAVDPAAVVK